MPNPTRIESQNSTRPRTLAGLCLLLSGAASLTYELVWIKQLTLLIGGTLYAISTVLCAFMTGLVLGAWGIGKYLERRRDSSIGLLRLYGLLEGLMGLYGLAFPWLLESTTALYPHMVSLAGGSASVLHLLEFTWGTLLMLPSTFLMGATLPVLVSWAINREPDSILSNVSLFYGINTLGAVIGCLFTQLVSLHWLGIAGATHLAVGLNALVFFLCWFTKQPEADTEPPTIPLSDKTKPDHELTPLASGMLLFLFAYSGMVALSSEILWTRILVFPLGSSLYSFALILAAFLFGIGAGSLTANKLFSGRSLILTFLMLEGSLGLLGLLMTPTLDLITPLTSWMDAHFYGSDNTALQTLLIRSLVVLALMFPPAFGFGLIFPVANQIQLNLFRSIPNTLGGCYAVNTFGSILGTVLTPFVFIPFFGIERSLFFLFAGMTLLAIIAFHLLPKRTTSGKLIAAVSLVLIALFYGVLKPGSDSQRMGQNNLARIDFGTTSETLKLIDYKEGDFATLSVVEDTHLDTRTLYVNGFSTATVSEKFGGTSYMEAMGFIPMMLHPDPQKALVMCFGTGSTVSTVAGFPGAQVDGVEIDQNVLNLAPRFSRWNHDVLERPNVQFFIQDARQFVRWSEESYDVITLEPMHPAHAGVAHLYSQEFYEQAKRRLKPGGILMQWLPLHLLTPEDSLAVLETFRREFPHTSLWNSFLTRIVLLVGSDSPVTLNPDQFLSRMKIPEVAEAAEGIGVRSFLDFADFFMADASWMKSELFHSDIITDNRSLLEHSTVNLLPPFAKETDETFLNLLLHRVGQLPPLDGLTEANQTLLKKEYDKRTAQRLSVFSQRYNGPGATAFAKKQWDDGLSKVRNFWEPNKGSWVRVANEGWAVKGGE